MVQGADGRGPDVPDGVGFLLLADPLVTGSSYALYRLDVPETMVVPQARPLPEDVEALIGSGEDYPPALAQARDAVELREGHEPQPDDFLRRYADHLTGFLAAQRESEAFLARCAEGQLGYLTPGAWYWLLARAKDGSRVRWVSSDFHVYADSSEAFDVPPDLLRRLPVFS